MLAAIIFGWPAILASLALCFAGLLAKRPLLVALGGVLFIAPSVYLGGNPWLGWYTLGLPLCLFGSAFALMKKKGLVAWLMTLPVLLLTVWLGVLVLTQ